jgi:phospholipase D1/2
MIVDDRLLHIGSANLTSRSLGVDTECDVAIEAADRRVAGGIARVRARLLGEHLGLAPEEAAAESAAAGLVATVDRHADGARRLVPLEAPAPADRGHSPVEAIADPTEPIALADLGRRLVPAAAQARGRRAYVRLGLTLAAVVGLVLVWQLTPLRDWLDARRLVAWAEPLRHHPLAPLAALGVYAAASLVMCPINLLVLATVLVFGPFLGALVALAGVLLSSVQMWAIGRLVGAEGVRRLGGRRVLAVRRQLQRRGIVTMTLVRLVPVAPAPLVSLAAGAFDVKLGDFTVGTALGMAPGILGLALLGERLLAALVHPTPGKIAAALAVAGLLVAVVLGGRALLRRRRGR